MESPRPAIPDEEAPAPVDEQGEGDGIDWDNVAAETRIMLDLNRSAAQARDEQGQQP